MKMARSFNPVPGAELPTWRGGLVSGPVPAKPDAETCAFVVPQDAALAKVQSNLVRLHGGRKCRAVAARRQGSLGR
jgi:hypothetical protein